MKRSKWGKMMLAAAGLGVLAVGASRAQSPADSQIVVLHEAGKSEQRCVIEYALMRQDGKTMYYVRDLATGERLRVLDNRNMTHESGPIVGRVLGRLNSPSDAGMARALESSPVKNTTTVLGATAPKTAGIARTGDSPRTPTAAELAGAKPVADKTAPAAAPKFTPAVSTKPAAKPESIPPVQVQLTQLKQGTPAQREAAAKVLAVSKARTNPEVVKAIVSAAQNDSTASVRTTCVRCLYKISSEVPSVIPVIANKRTDKNPEVAATAAKAMEEIGKRK